MSARLISYSKPADESMTMLDLVAYCARVSNPANQDNKTTNEKLVKYLIKNKHWSPLEMASVCLEVNTTRDIARQLLRHRSFSFQEFSQRYAVVDFGSESKMSEVREARLQDKKNRQNSIHVDDAELKRKWEELQNEVISKSGEVYQWALDNGIAKEQARVVLPEGNTMSRLYVNGTLRSWVHYIELRSGNGTQKEHRELAVACANAIAEVFPMIREFLAMDDAGY